MKRIPVYFAALALILSGCTTTDSIIQATPTPFAPSNATTPSSNTILQGIAYLPNEQPLKFASIAIYQNSTLLGGVETGTEGQFTLTVPSNTALTLEVSFVGYEPAIYQLQPLRSGFYYLDLSLHTPKPFIDGLYCPTYHIPLIDMDNTSSGATYLSGDLKHSPLFPGGL